MLEKNGDRYMNKIQLYSYSKNTYPKKKLNSFLKNRLQNQGSYGWSKKSNSQRYTLSYADFDCKEKKNSEQKSRELLSKNDKSLDSLIQGYFLDSLIQGYFLADPSNRPKQCKNIGRYLNSVEGILLVLDWSRKKMIKEPYDSAVDLLARCGKILLKVIDNESITDLFTKDIIAYEEKLEVLITGIAFAHSIPPQERLTAITSLIPSSRRVIKAAIIDALLILDDEVSSDILKYYLAKFLSTDEIDEYIRQYANDALKEF